MVDRDMVMHRRLAFFCFLAVMLTACAPSRDSIVAVTPLGSAIPVVATSTPQPVPPTETPMSSANSGGFGALVAAANEAPPTPTPTPRDENLPAGNARDIARATDMAYQPTPRTPMTFDTVPVSLIFDEFYDGYNLRTGLQLSDKLVALDGQAVVIEGYMAPPLKPDLDYFVLTRVRLAFCPFCSTANDWPDDIALVYMTDGTTTASDAPLRVTGVIEVGASVDRETGMVSLVRIYADRLERLP